MVLGRIENVDCFGAGVGHIHLAVSTDRDAAGRQPYLDRGGDLVGGGIDHRNGMAAGIRHVDPPAIRTHGHTVGLVHHRYGGHDFVTSPGIDHRDAVRRAVSHVDSRANRSLGKARRCLL